MNAVHFGGIMPKIITDPSKAIQIAAKEIMAEDGYEGLNMRNVAKRSGIAIGTVYNYFENKEAIVIHLMLAYWNAFFEVIDEIDSMQFTFYEKMAHIYTHFKVFTDDFHEIFLSQSFKPTYTDKSRANKDDFMYKLQERFCKMVASGIDHKKIDLDCNEIAEFILANFIAITYMPTYSYDKFEKALKAIVR
jgi:AcrR family transcriptional regulator